MSDSRAAEQAPAAPPTPAAVRDRGGRDLRPPRFRQHPLLQLAVFIVLAVVATRPFVGNASAMHYLNQWLMYAVAGAGFYLMFVVAGRFAFCQTFMMLTGGYTAAYLSQTHGFLYATVAATAIVGLIALAFAVVVARTESFLFAVATLALGQIGTTVYTNWTSFSGPEGISSNVPYPDVFGRVLDTEGAIYWMFLAAVVVCVLVVLLIERSAVGREATATREMPEVARSLGIGTRKVQLALFVVGSAMGGLAGALTAYWQGSMSSGTFSLDLALGLFLIPILGGVTTVWGTVVGSLIYVELANVLSQFQQYASLAYGVALLIVIIVLPQGLVGGGKQLLSWAQPDRYRPGRVLSARQLLRRGGG